MDEDQGFHEEAQGVHDGERAEERVDWSPHVRSSENEDAEDVGGDTSDAETDGDWVVNVLGRRR